MVMEELQQRGLIAQVSDGEGLAAHLSGASRTLYCGFDPTADSLHIGNLAPLLVLRRFQLRGHRPILLLGGATGLIGDPSFRSDERPLIDRERAASRVERFRRQAAPLLDFEGGAAAILANNLDWTGKLNVIDFLRDIGKHFSVNAMIQRDSVKGRLAGADVGISYTEFSYMLLQANDYLELAQRHGCSLQVGGSDQWGNIVSGVDLVRRRLGRKAFALTLPLVTRADGAKFGKTKAGAIWLDSARTSPYSFYQFWLNRADADAVRYLKMFTFLDLAEIAALEAGQKEAPQLRTAQIRLAEQITELVHGRAALESAQRISRCLFGDGLEALQPGDLEQLRLDGMACTELRAGQIGLLAALADGGLAPSRGAARSLVESGGLSVNGQVQRDAGRMLDFSDALHGKYYLLRRGRKTWHLLARR